MSLCTLEYQGAYAKQDCYYYPEICTGIEMFKKPLITIHGIAISLNDIGHRIKLYYPFDPVGKHVYIPKNRCGPLSHL
jgi:hypothetical protein